MARTLPKIVFCKCDATAAHPLLKTLWHVALRVRHEAGEALGAIGTAECYELLRSYQDDACLEVAQTCQLALQRIQHFSQAARPMPPGLCMRRCGRMP